MIAIRQRTENDQIWSGIDDKLKFGGLEFQVKF